MKICTSLPTLSLYPFLSNQVNYNSLTEHNFKEKCHKISVKSTLLYLLRNFLVKTSLSRNFCQKSVRDNFSFFHFVGQKCRCVKLQNFREIEQILKEWKQKLISRDIFQPSLLDPAYFHNEHLLQKFHTALLVKSIFYVKKLILR